MGGSEKIYKGWGGGGIGELSAEGGVQIFYILWSTKLPLYAKSLLKFLKVLVSKQFLEGEVVGNSVPSNGDLN